MVLRIGIWILKASQNWNFNPLWATYLFSVRVNPKRLKSLSTKELGAVHIWWAGPATWAGSATWVGFHSAFIWNFLFHCKNLSCHCKKIVLITWLLSGKCYIFSIDSRRLQQFHFPVYSSIMNVITAFSILLQLHGILLILVLFILDFTYLVVLVVAILKSNLERIPKHTHAF